MKTLRIFLLVGMVLCMDASFLMASPLRERPTLEYTAPPMLVVSDLCVKEQADKTVHQIVADATPINQYTTVGFVATVKQSLVKWAGHRTRWYSYSPSEQGFKFQIYESNSLTHPRIRYLSR